MSEKLLPCPFCGGMPNRKYLESGKEYIACENTKCLVSPVTAAYKAKGAAARAWNRRAQPANEPLTCAGYDIDGLMITAELLRKYDVRPENLLDLCKNMKSCYEIVRKDVDESFKRSLEQAIGTITGGEQDA